MSEYVRVKDPDTGHEYTTGAQHAKNAGLTVTSKDPVDRFGRPLPAKYHTKKSGARTGGSGTAGKEN